MSASKDKKEADGGTKGAAEEKTTKSAVEEKKTVAAGETTRSAAPAAAQPPLVINDDAVQSNYANFCRVTGSPEELIIDFGLNAQPMGVPQSGSIRVTERVVINYFTAKRLVHALHMSIQRHEAVFGVLETDVQKRVRAPVGSRAET